MGLIHKINSLLPQRIQNNKGIFPALLPALGGALKGAAASGLASAASSGLAKLFGGGDEESGFMIQNLPQDPALLRARNQGLNFLQDQMAAVQRGETPQFFQNLMPTIEGGLRRDLGQTFFGQPGRRGEGLVGQALGIGSQAGVGPRAAVAQTNKQLQDFSNRSRQIDEFIASQGIESATNVFNRAPSSIRNLTDANTLIPTTIQPFTSGGGGGFQPGEDFTTALSGGFGSIFDAFKKKQSPTTTSTLTPEMGFGINPFGADNRGIPSLFGSQGTSRQGGGFISRPQDDRFRFSQRGGQ